MRRKVKQLTTKDVNRLTVDWYKKLKDSGFKDIEWINSKGRGQDSRYTYRASNKVAQKFNQNTELHYQLCTNFCTHYPFPTKKHQFLFNLYAEGYTYREILRKLRYASGGWHHNRAGKPIISLFSLHKLISFYIKLAHKWNETNPEGLLHPDYIDYKASKL